MTSADDVSRRHVSQNRCSDTNVTIWQHSVTVGCYSVTVLRYNDCTLQNNRRLQHNTSSVTVQC